MKKTYENKTISYEATKKPTVLNFFTLNLKKLKQGQFTCPLCKEVLQGISKFGVHIKKHCT